MDYLVVPAFEVSGKDEWNCPDGEVESVVVSADGEWIEPDTVRGIGVGETDGVTVSVSAGAESGVILPAMPASESEVVLGPAMPLPLGSDSSDGSDGRRILGRHFVEGGWNLIAGPKFRIQNSKFQIIPVGDYLALRSEAGMEFLVWDRSAGEYRNIGSGMPRASVEFALVREAVTPFSLTAAEWPKEQISIPMTVADEGYKEALISEGKH